MARFVFLALAFFAALLLRADAQGGRRVALVIGNGSYEEAGRLANPVNDALDLAVKLRSIGFEVIEGHDLGKRALERKIGEFSDALDGASVGLLFYAGHGLQVDGRNFIVPVDARLDVPAKLRLETVQIDDVLDIMEQQTATSIVFLDACRNNPFVRSLTRTATKRSAAALSGLAQFDSSRGSFIAFSTAPGAVAQDGGGRNSPFATALLRHIDRPGQSINDMMIAVRRDVISETRDTQRPWEQGSLVERFEFVPQAGAPAPAPMPAAPPPVEMSALQRSTGNGEDVRALIDDYLAPEAGRMRETVERLYADRASLFGSPMGRDAIVQAKSDWFARWAAWSLALEPGSLAVTPQSGDRAEATFTIGYDYRPKDAATPRATGRARVTLGLERDGGAWRIVSETSAPL